jgi:putative SOS response-associated peptidase YedK
MLAVSAASGYYKAGLPRSRRAASASHRGAIVAMGEAKTQSVPFVRKRWQKQGAGRKQPYCIRPRAGGLFALAGLWERWNDPQDKTVETCTILTTEANELMRPLHDRMPVILDPAADGVWLDPRSSTDALRSLFVPFASERMEALPVNPWVSDPKHEGPRCLEPA